ncbi:MAG: hypothetical protein JWN25_1137, partial [Verrucomicrobiales bacterium]|nr:hypothetical protein [Verrucomicrobiales bacterium]MDB6130847.1 hypothetical protein [Verrucomicrobiales bacterium]
MKILALSNLYPPHHAGTFDERCQRTVDNLKLRGHEVVVLTSNHGLNYELRNPEVERRLLLNNAFGHPKVDDYNNLKKMEVSNSSVLKQTVEQCNPDIIHVFSLLGLSKSLIFSLRNTRIPTVYDVSDHWLASEIREDPWLRFWNAPSLSGLGGIARSSLEVSGERLRLDVTAPTRMMKGYDRLPGVYGDVKTIAKVDPNSLPGFRFDRIYFCSQALKTIASQSGFQVNHAEVIYPGIDGQQFFGELKPQSMNPSKYLIVSPLDENSGIMTAIKALKEARRLKENVSLTICGRGDNKHIAALRSFVVTNALPVEFISLSNQNKDIAAIYRKHDAFLYVSEWAEPFSLPVLQAMACGLPVIAANSGGVDELVRHGENGLTFSRGDHLDLASRMQELRMQPALRCQMAEIAQSEVLSKYNESTVVDQIENYLNVSQETWVHAAS